MKLFVAVALIVHAAAGSAILAEAAGFETTVAIVGTLFTSIAARPTRDRRPPGSAQ